MNPRLELLRPYPFERLRALPVHVQLASIAAWADEAHVAGSRRLYRDKFAAVLPALRESLEVDAPAGAFYLWPRVGVDERFARGLFERQHVTVLPGSCLSRASVRGNPERGRVRISLVAGLEDCVEAARRIAQHARTGPAGR